MGYRMSMTKEQLAVLLETDPGPLVSMARVLGINRTTGFDIIFHLYNIEYPSDFGREQVDNWIKSVLRPEWTPKLQLYAAFVASYIMGGVHMTIELQAVAMRAQQAEAKAKPSKPSAPPPPPPGSNPLPRPPGFTGGAN